MTTKSASSSSSSQIHQPKQQQQQQTKPKHKRMPPKKQQTPARSWIKNLLMGLTCVSLGASLFLPFQDNMLGWVAIFSLLGGHFAKLGFWLFPFITLYFIRVLFNLISPEPKIPILKSLFLLILMIFAVASLRGSEFHTNIGIGVFFWLMAGYLLLMTSICTRYPNSYHNIKWLSSSLLMFIACTAWTQYANSHRELAAVWHTKDAVLPDTPESNSVNNTALGAVIAPNFNPNNQNNQFTQSNQSNQNHNNNKSASEVVTNIKPLINVNLDQKSLISVERVFDVHNPWAQHGAVTSCETAIKRNYPILLPPRFLEDGYEWRNYHHGDNICNNLMYVGAPNTSKNFDFKYQITQDPRSNIYLIMSDKKSNALFNETFAISRDFNGLKDNNTYIEKLNSVFSRVVDDNAIPMLDGEYTFTKAEVPNQNDILARGCEMKQLHRSNLFQWGTGRVDFRGQSVAKVDTFCSKNNVGMTHLSIDDTKEGDDWENKLHIKLFRGKDLKPLECGALSVNLDADETRQFFTGALKVEQLNMTPSNKNCLSVSVLLSNGKTLFSQ